MAKKSVKGVDLTSGFFDEPEEIIEDTVTEEQKASEAAPVVSAPETVSEDKTEDKTNDESQKKKKGRPKKLDSEKKKNHNIALHPAVYDEILKMAAKKHMTISQLIHIAVDEYLERENK